MLGRRSIRTDPVDPSAVVASRIVVACFPVCFVGPKLQGIQVVSESLPGTPLDA